jgi:hypothetical protein
MRPGKELNTPRKSYGIYEPIILSATRINTKQDSQKSLMYDISRLRTVGVATTAVSQHLAGTYRPFRCFGKRRRGSTWCASPLGQGTARESKPPTSPPNFSLTSIRHGRCRNANLTFLLHAVEQSSVFYYWRSCSRFFSFYFIWLAHLLWRSACLPACLLLIIRRSPHQKMLAVPHAGREPLPTPPSILDCN